MKRILIIVAVIIVVGAAIALAVWQSNKNKDNQAADTVMAITAFNQTKNADATAAPASPKDNIVYTLTVENKGDKVASGYVVEVNIEDISQLATLIDASGANYNSANNSLIWTPIDIPSKGSIEKKFTVRVKDPLPANTDSVMTAKFNNEVSVQVKPGQTAAQTPAQQPTQTKPTPTKPAPTVAGNSYRAPKTGPGLLLVVAVASGLTAAAVFILRRQ
ncbi:MAG: hypothetical protein ACM3NH_04590 [Candidatus Saccharibacteria bacterium]